MGKVDMVIKNATLVSPMRIVKAGIAVDEGKIVSISKEANLPSSERTLDAKGLLVFPGCIDVHVHLEAVVPSVSATIESETRSAAFGGVTTIIDFAWPRPGEEAKSALERIIRELSTNSVIDFALHAGIRPMSIGDRRKLIDQAFDHGITSFKMLMAYKREGRMVEDDSLFDVFQYISKRRGLSGVHAENGYLVEYFNEKFRKEGKNKPIYHAKARPNFVEEIAICSALKLARTAQVDLYIFHLSTGEGLEAIRDAKRNGQRVFTETCPHYLLMTNEIVERLGPYSIMNPPLRSTKDVYALWKGVTDGTIDVISTDHAPLDTASKESGWNEYWKASPGIPGVETRFPLLYTEAITKRGLSPTLLCRLLCSNPARIFGIERKGSIAVGFDADLIFIDPKKKMEIKAEHLHSKSDWTPFENMVATGFPVLTMIRGKVVSKDGQFYGKNGQSQYLPRKVAT